MLVFTHAVRRITISRFVEMIKLLRKLQLAGGVSNLGMKLKMMDLGESTPKTPAVQNTISKFVEITRLLRKLQLVGGVRNFSSMIKVMVRMASIQKMGTQNTISKFVVMVTLLRKLQLTVGVKKFM